MDSYGGRRSSGIEDGLVQLSSPDQSLSSPLLDPERISVLLSRWSALTMAVQNQWGGPDSFKKYQLLVSDIASWFSQPSGSVQVHRLELGSEIKMTMNI